MQLSLVQLLQKYDLHAKMVKTSNICVIIRATNFLTKKLKILTL